MQVPKDHEECIAMVQESTGLSREELKAAAENDGKRLELYCEEQLVLDHVSRIAHGFLSASLALCWPVNMPGVEQSMLPVIQQTQEAIHRKTYKDHQQFLRGILYEMGRSAISAIEQIDQDALSEKSVD
tara:strand:+ start:783 stop:1169 length:387 start_codon:yes stop_codon:yes gene_type:complete